MSFRLKLILSLIGGFVIVMAAIVFFLGYTSSLPIDYVHISQLVPERASMFLQVRGLNGMVGDVLDSDTGESFQESAAYRDMAYSPQYYAVQSRLDALGEKGYPLSMKGLLSLVGTDLAYARVPTDEGTAPLFVFEVSFWNRVFTRALSIARGEQEKVPHSLSSPDGVIYHAAVANFIFVSTDSSLLAESISLAVGESDASLYNDSIFSALYVEPDNGGRSVLHYRHGAPSPQSFWSYRARHVGVWPGGDGLAVRMEAVPGPGGVINSLVSSDEPEWGYNLVPEGCAFAAVGSVDPQGLWSFLRGEWLPDDRREQSERSLSEFERSSGADIGEGLIPALGGAAVFVLDTVYTGEALIAPGFALVVEQSDAEVVRKEIGALFEYALRSDNEVRDTVFAEIPVRYYAPKDSSISVFTVAYAVADDALFVGTTLPTLQEVLSVNAGALPPLSADEFGEKGQGVCFSANGPELLAALRAFFDVDVRTSPDYTRRDLEESFYPFLDLAEVVEGASGNLSVSDDRLSLTAEVRIDD
jgi:hypothetical protein